VISSHYPTRRACQQVMVGQVPVGGDAPIVIQSMTNTDTADAAATVAQVLELARAGSEVVRITVNSAEAPPKWPRFDNSLMTKAVTYRWWVIFTLTVIAYYVTIPIVHAL